MALYNNYFCGLVLVISFLRNYTLGYLYKTNDKTLFNFQVPIIKRAYSITLD